MKKGIDISKWQGKISDSAWADITKKVDYVIIRVGYRGYGSGELKVDEQFQSNLNACKKFGIAYGLYFFSQAISAKEAEKEVELISSLVDIKSAQYGVWCDTELSNDGKGRGDTISREARTTAVKAFCDAVRAKGGSGGIYANYYWIKDNLIADELANYDIWCACYLKECLYKGKNLTMWQYSSGNALGIAGFSSLDCNYCYKDYAAVQTKAPEPRKTVEQLAKEVIDGKWENGEERKKKLAEAGYDYNAVQNKVNELLKPPETVHTVAKGESLWKISEHYFGKGNRYPEIKEANGLTSDIIKIGQRLKIPKND